MHSVPRSAAPRKSGFAAAFFSLLFPGLGHAYLGRWSRALGWAALPVLVIALVAGLIANPATFEQVQGWVFEPMVLLGVVGFLALDLVYRLFCVLDAYRLARAPGGTATGMGMASVAGLAAVLLVLVASHVAIARPVLIAHDSLVDITGGTEEEPQGSFAPLDGSFVVPFTQPPTPTPDPSASIEPTPTPAPTPTQGPAWDEGGRLNILLIGADAGRPGYSNYLTDTMMLVTVDTATKQTAFISLPRDTSLLPIPRDWPAYDAWGGRFGGKANEIYAYASYISPGQYPGPTKNKGFNALKAMLGELFQMRIDYFVAIDLNSFRAVINDLGGVMVDVQNPVFDFHYPADDGLSGHIKLYVPPGIRYMDGREALAYARSRKETSDFDRVARQQRVITSVREQLDLSALLAPGVIQDLLQTFRSSIKTDIPPGKIPKLIQLAQEIDLDDRISLVLDPPDYSTSCYPCPPNGQYVLKANVPKIRQDVANIFKRDRAEVERAAEIKSEGALVHVLNGTRSNNAKTTKISDVLASLGVDAIVPPVNAGAADSVDYTQTVITVYNGAEQEMPLTIGFLERKFEVTAVLADDPEQTADIVIVVGSETPQIRP